MPKRKAAGSVGAAPQLVVRVSRELDGDLRAAAAALDIDVSNLVRMVLTEHLGEYIERGVLARKKLREARAKLAGPGAGVPAPAEATSNRPALPKGPFKRAIDFGPDAPGERVG